MFPSLDQGIIPNAMEHMFQRINDNSDTQLTFRVECSMVEIYNERIRDLFVRFERGKEKKGGLKLRDSPKQGDPQGRHRTNHPSKRPPHLRFHHHLAN